MTNDMWHEGKVAVVTGGTSGIGLEIAQVLQRRGATVAVGGRQKIDAYPQLDGAQMAFEQLDVCDTASVERYLDFVRQRCGRPDILVNAAGVSVHQEVVGHSDEDWNAVIDTNLNGPFRVIRGCLPEMLENRWGRIVNIASTAATTAVSTHAAYCASKAGLLGLTRAVALEGAARGVTCTAVSPTWVETPMLTESMETMAARSGRAVEQERQKVASANPQNRLVQPGEIAELVSFLCSDLSPALTMEDIQVNAGAHW